MRRNKMKKTKSTDYLEATVLYKHGGKIDLATRWAREDIEADPERIDQLIKANEAN